MILAGIDIGTNSLRLLIAQTAGGSLRKISTDRRTTRLGRGLEGSGRISEASAVRTIAGLREFMSAAAAAGVQETEAVGTSALRRAGNAEEFIRRARSEAGVSITVLTGTDEARLTVRGISAGLKQGNDSPHAETETTVFVDIGGGSTEIIVTERHELAGVFSISLGAVYLTERYLHGDPPAADEIAMLRSAIRNELSGLGAGAGRTRLQRARMIGTAGTITTLASMYLRLKQYDSERISSTVLTRAFIDATTQSLGASTLNARSKIEGLESGREDIIFAGALVLQELMDHWDIGELRVSDWGLREGVVLDLADRLAGPGKKPQGK